MELTREQFREVIPKGTSQDDESHHSWGAILYWHRDGKTYEEYQPDWPTYPVRWFVRS